MKHNLETWYGHLAHGRASQGLRRKVRRKVFAADMPSSQGPSQGPVSRYVARFRRKVRRKVSSQGYFDVSKVVLFYKI